MSRHGFDPELVLLPHYNHFSQDYSFGTDDTSLAGPVLGFVRRGVGGATS